MKFPKPSARLLQALKAPQVLARQSTENGTIEVRAAGGNNVELWIYGPIGYYWWDDTAVSAGSVIEELRGLNPSQITVRINSYGGSVSDGIAIYNELRRHADESGAQIVVEIGAVAISIASLIAAAGDVVRMPSNALQMLHAPWGSLYVDGNAQQVREVAEEFANVLEVYGKAMAPSYARKTGKPISEYEAMWADGKDHWFSAEEALAHGLIDEITGLNESSDEEQASFTNFINALGEDMRPTVFAAFKPNPVTSAEKTKAASTAAPNEETTMSVQTNHTAVENAPAVNQPAPTALAEGVSVAVASIATRNAEIRAMAAPYASNPEITAIVNAAIDAADPEITADIVGRQILAHLGKQAQPLNGGAHVQAGEDSRDKRVQGMSEAITARCGRTAVSQGNQFAGMSLREMARACAEAAGVNTRGVAPSDYIQAAITHTSSDFPAITQGVIRTAVLRGFNGVAESYEKLARVVPVTDFKETSLAGLGQFNGIAEVLEGEEYEYGTFSSSKAKVKITKRGGIFSITDEAIINDDLGLFDSVPFKMGQSAKRSLGDDIFRIITDANNYSSGNGNLMTGSALTTASLEEAFGKIALAKDADGNLLGLQAKVLVVPVGKGATARQILTSAVEIVVGKNATASNTMLNRFIIVEDARLDVNDPKAWYVVADPELFDTLIIAALDGVIDPTVTTKVGWNVDGLETKVRLNAAAGLVEARGLVKNPGV